MSTNVISEHEELLDALRAELENHDVELDDRDPEVAELTMSPEKLKVFMGTYHCNLAQPT